MLLGLSPAQALFKDSALTARLCLKTSFKTLSTALRESMTRLNFGANNGEKIVEQSKDHRTANFQIVVVCLTGNLTKASQISQRDFLPPLENPEDPNGITITCCLQYPVSRGSVHIRSADPEDQPDIDPAYPRESADVDVLVAEMKTMGKLVKAKPLKSKLRPGRLHPNPELDLTDKEACKKAVMEWYAGEYHICGSVAMGDALDSDLKVKGAERLRVADASIFPGNVSGNIMSSVYILAERAADLIKEEWKGRETKA